MAAGVREPEQNQEDTDTLARVGGWLFRQRSSLPVPLALALLLIPWHELPASTTLAALGAGCIAAGELVRLWGVHHIGAISRTRSDRLGPLVSSGPFALVRNPLYIGNILLWIGFAFAARLAWMAPVALVMLGLEYHAIVRWEERLLAARRGAEYRDYCARVPRWIPRLPPAASAAPPVADRSWRATFFSERGTLIAIAAGYTLLWVKFRFPF